MILKTRNLVLVHGLWDTPQVFSGLTNHLCRDDLVVFAPNLPHHGGKVPLNTLAHDLDRLIIRRFGGKSQVEILGFSMGGLIARAWLQNLGGFLRASDFISVGSPHRGTFTAQLVPSFLFPGIADMKRDSDFISELNQSSHLLEQIKCRSYFCRWDLMACPGWEAVLPNGSHNLLPVLTHKDLISNPDSLRILAKDILIGRH